MKQFLSEFKTFIMRGNVMDMAVGVIVGAAFTAIITTLTDSVLQPILNAVMGHPTEGWSFVNSISALLSSIVNFLITALVLFLILKAFNKLTSLTRKKEAPPTPTTKECPFCKTEIHIDATRCPHCTSQLSTKA